MDPRLREAYSRCVREVARGLIPDLVNGLYDYLVIDLASITYGLKDPRAFLVNVRLAIDYGYLRPGVIFVVDYSRPEHEAVSGSMSKWLGPCSTIPLLSMVQPNLGLMGRPAEAVRHHHQTSTHTINQALIRTEGKDAR